MYHMIDRQSIVNACTQFASDYWVGRGAPEACTTESKLRTERAGI